MFIQTCSLSNAVTFSERAYLTPKHTELTINTSPKTSVMWPYDTPCAISYRCSVVTEVVSPAVWDNGPQTFWGHDLDLSRSRDVIDSPIANRFTIGYFLLVVHCNQVSISKPFWDIWFFNKKYEKFSGDSPSLYPSLSKRGYPPPHAPLPRSL